MFNEIPEHMRWILTSLLILVLAISCKKKSAESQLKIIESFLLDSIPSGSGIALYKDSLFIISDDGSVLYKLSINDGKFSKIRIRGLNDSIYRIDKSIKPDPESLVTIKIYGIDYLMAFGSGSKSPQRDSLLVMPVNEYERQQKISLTPFYKHLKAVTKTTDANWNLEGAALIGDSLFLLNRGNNMIIALSMPAMINGVIFSYKSFMPASRNSRVKLPAINNHEARFSGLATINKDLAIFCASVEDTDDWTQDGAILGSYVGIINIHSKELISTQLLVDSTGKRLIEKLESVEFISQDKDGNVQIYAIADNDNGSSKLFRLSLPLNKDIKR